MTTDIISHSNPALEAIDQLLNSFAHFGVELGLERIERLLDRLGNPQNQVPIIHVAGSNGKGSTCAYLSAILKQAGYRVARYISPHLIDWTERICINDEAIAPSDLHSLLLQVKAAIDPDYPSPTQFEIITAAAWLYFAQQKVDLAVIEVGLGGRLDATNVCDRPLVSVITSLSREHWQRLGNTLAEITFEKAGILKADRPAVIAPQPPEAEAVLKKRLAELNCPTLWVEPSTDLGQGWAEYGGLGIGDQGSGEGLGIRDWGLGNEEQTIEKGQHSFDSSHRSPESNTRFPLAKRSEGLPAREALRRTPRSRSAPKEPPTPNPQSPIPNPLSYPLPLPGAHQLINSALAIATIQLLREQGWRIEDEAIVSGMANTRWMGRLQWTTWNNQPLLIDGAHNPAGAIALRQYLDQNDRVHSPIAFVMGMIGTKDHADILRELLREGDRLFLVPVPDHAATDLEDVAIAAKAVCPNLEQVCIYDDVLEALAVAMRSNSPSTTVLCGSLYLIGHFFKISAVG